MPRISYRKVYALVCPASVFFARKVTKISVASNEIYMYKPRNELRTRQWLLYSGRSIFTFIFENCWTETWAKLNLFRFSVFHFQFSFALWLTWYEYWNLQSLQIDFEFENWISLTVNQQLQSISYRDNWPLKIWFCMKIQQFLCCYVEFSCKPVWQNYLYKKFYILYNLKAKSLRLTRPLWF